MVHFSQMLNFKVLANLWFFCFICVSTLSVARDGKRGKQPTKIYRAKISINGYKMISQVRFAGTQIYDMYNYRVRWSRPQQWNDDNNKTQRIYDLVCWLKEPGFDAERTLFHHTLQSDFQGYTGKFRFPPHMDISTQCKVRAVNSAGLKARWAKTNKLLIKDIPVYLPGMEGIDLKGLDAKDIAAVMAKSARIAAKQSAEEKEQTTTDLTTASVITTTRASRPTTTTITQPTMTIAASLLSTTTPSTTTTISTISATATTLFISTTTTVTTTTTTVTTVITTSTTTTKTTTTKTSSSSSSTTTTTTTTTSTTTPTSTITTTSTTTSTTTPTSTIATTATATVQKKPVINVNLEDSLELARRQKLEKKWRLDWFARLRKRRPHRHYMPPGELPPGYSGVGWSSLWS